jgi:hypothetical protein
MTLRTESSDRDVRTRSAVSRVDLGTRYVTVHVWCRLLQEGVGGSEIMIINDEAHGAREG